ncbi:MAG TPA: type II toxin-antitoxin system prevent-host-death family antitoxin [Kofleriaceae bacterium]
MAKHVQRVGIHEAKTRWSRLLRDVENGGEVILQRGGRPIARIVPALETASPGSSYGMFAGQFTTADDFDVDSNELGDLFGVVR